jgi:hypothetical protein
MSQKAKELAGRLQAFSDDVVAFVEGCSEKNWEKACKKEQWPVGVTARHIGAGHFEAIELARMIVKGEKLPEFTMEQLVEMANDHAASMPRVRARRCSKSSVETARHSSATWQDCPKPNWNEPAIWPLRAGN